MLPFGAHGFCSLIPETMARNKNTRKKKPAQQTNGGYKKYIRDVIEAAQLIGLRTDASVLSNTDKHRLYEGRLRIMNPEVVEGYVSHQELKRITQKVKEYYRERNIQLNGAMFSAYQCSLLQDYATAMKKVVYGIHKNKNHPQVDEYNSVRSKFFRLAYGYIITHYYKIITQLSNPEYKYFGLRMRITSIYKENPAFGIVPEIYGIPAQVKKFTINNQQRPAFRLGKQTAVEPLIWITVEKSVFGENYNGNKSELDIYIQSHAINRLCQRLDLLKRPAINYILWQNTNTIDELMTHRGKLLLPVKIYDTKIGYLVAEVVDEVLLFKTFLFITHNFTPEGDALRRISGLGKEDISYWKIDRLSTFINLDTGKYPVLTELFKKAGLSDIFQLKDKDFDVEQMQEANLDGLVRYIERGKNADTVQKQEFEALLQNA